MTEQFSGNVNITNDEDEITVTLDGKNGNIYLGGNGHDGDVVVRNSQGQDTISLNGSTGNLSLGGNGQDGDIHVKNPQGQQTIWINGSEGNIYLGNNNQDGDLHVRNASGQDTIVLHGDTGNMVMGGNGQDGDIFIRNSAGEDTIHVSGEDGDIIFKNADCAEDFEVRVDHDASPGTVMVITDGGILEESSYCYDKRVAGVIAGAGDLRPGLILGRSKDGDGKRRPIALIGCTYCKVEADSFAVEIGDLLTTSSLPGYAMKSMDSTRSSGAVIGKALEALQGGKRLIKIMVSLQ